MCEAGYCILEAKLLPYQSPGTYQIKTFCGGVIIWFEKTGTLSFQGKDPTAKKLKEDLTPYIEQKSKTPSPKTSSNTSNKKIFIVHGHDHVSLKDLELSFRRLGFELYILQNTGGNGLPIIETLKKEICNDSIGFGIVLLTPDDMGYAKSDGEEAAQPRARQNVIFEMGMLAAVFPLERIAILQKKGVEIPSDIHGVYYLSFNEYVKEIMPKLSKRLGEAGFTIDPEKLAYASS
ncbi:TIR domain-containing protein [Bartonella henselae]|uniref:TIR domain-containing protein n=1 Tax=Bartonella henselae TaxID=38323 RepID=UPI00068893FC|nr:TIR domain-containing protein [Bartonella henselae]OLL51028.1 hypothetical protein AT247_05050 [Bartonella henselae]OLL51253.1 hypothetical protein AT241_05870 [Bartonella henselae]OLL52676.1 hypothetical protein AT239_03980 [Bartonella henselae]OLL53417.1 hypothetical protein AT240_03010 [Bartonella henselae]UJM33682.1 nucleotide-binding protein [Bartonella henselae]